VGHAEIKNRTPFAFEMNFTTDEEGTPVAVLIIKATYEISERGHLVLAENTGGNRKNRVTNMSRKGAL
jgi:hypothetical protein